MQQDFCVFIFISNESSISWYELNTFCSYPTVGATKMISSAYRTINKLKQKLLAIPSININGKHKRRQEDWALLYTKVHNKLVSPTIVPLNTSTTVGNQMFYQIHAGIDRSINFINSTWWFTGFTFYCLTCASFWSPVHCIHVCCIWSSPT